MTETQTARPEEFDAVIIGAGMAGLYQLHRLLELGMTVRVFEDAPDVGGTWYWNCYPGARFDSESYSYGYLFSEELFKDWKWSEHFAARPEIYSYLRHVAERFRLRPHIAFNSRVERCDWDEAAQKWTVHTSTGESVRAQFLITAVGVLSATHIPDFPGIDEFQGEIHHSSRWPQGGVDLAGKRVGVIGTGSTGVQIIQTIAPEVGELVVFQRTAAYAAPLRNAPITPEEQERIQSGYADMVRLTKSTPGGFIHAPLDRGAMEDSVEAREAYYEARWAEAGFGKWLGLYADTLSDPVSNATMREFVIEKIRRRVSDPAVADKLIPKDLPFGAKRIPLETGYYEAFNQDNVHLVDLRQEPVERFHADGIRTAEHDYELDVVIFATGFDAVVGNLVRIDIRGRDGVSLVESFKDGPHSYMGLQIAGFPNLFPISGPLGGFVFCNVPRCLEENVDWITDCIVHMREESLVVIEPDPEAEKAWLAVAEEYSKQTVLLGTGSWFNGANIPGKVIALQMFVGGLIEFRRHYQPIAANGYQGFEFR